MRGINALIGRVTREMISLPSEETSGRLLSAKLVSLDIES